MTDTTTAAPIALQPGQGEALWFLGALVTIKASNAATAGGAWVTETLAPRGHGSPLHLHHNEDEWFYILEGELTFWVGGEVTIASAGSFAYAPREVPHTFIVSSVVRELAGHVDVRTTKTYVEVTDERKNERIAALEQGPHLLARRSRPPAWIRRC